MADVQPNYPTWQRPDFNLAPVLAKANAITLQDQSIAQNKVMNPLEAAKAQQQLEAETRSNDIGAATQDQTIAATNATLSDKIFEAKKSMSEGQWQQAVLRNQIMSKVTDYVLAHPGDPTAADAAEKIVVQSGQVPADQVAAWKAEVGDPMKASSLADGYRTFLNVAVSTGGSSYAKLPTIDKARLDTKAYEEAKTLNGGNAPTAAQMEASRQAIAARWGVTGVPAATPQPQEAAPASTGWDPNVSGFVKDRLSAIGDTATEAYGKVFGGGGPPAASAATPPPAEAAPSPEIGMPGAAATSGAAGDEPPKPAGKTRGVERAGSVQDDQSKWTKMIQGADGAPISTFTGDPSDEAAVRAWVNSLQMGSLFVQPGGKTTLQKHSNFK